jgi:hypothetical protein
MLHGKFPTNNFTRISLDSSALLVGSTAVIQPRITNTKATDPSQLARQTC